MKNIGKCSCLILAAVGIALSAGNALGAGKYPERPITFVIQSSAGGGSDIFARTISSAIEKDKMLSQPIVVENKPGGSGAIAYAYVAGKKKDPHYLLTATPSFLTTPLQQQSNVSCFYGVLAKETGGEAFYLRPQAHTSEAIAEIVGISPGNVTTRMNRIKSQLQRAFARLESPQETIP